MNIAERVAAAARWAGDLYNEIKKIPDLFARMGNSPAFQVISRFMENKGLTGWTGGPALEYVDVDRATAEDRLKREMSNAGAVRNAGQQSLEMARAVRPDRTKALPEKEKRGGSDTERLDDVEQFIRGLERSNALLKTEIDHFGQSNEKRAVATALVKLHAEAKDRLSPATEKEIADTTRLAQENAKLKSTYEDLEKAQRASAEAMRHFNDLASDAIGDLIIDGEKASDVLKRLASSLSRSLLQGALTGGGALGGLFGGTGTDGAAGGLLGRLIGGLPGRAGGGPVDAGRAYLVGERGPEVLVPRTAGMVVPDIRAMRPQTAMSGPVDNSRTFHVDARGAQVGVAEQIVGALKSYDRQLGRTLPQRLSTSGQRFG